MTSEKSAGIGGESLSPPSNEKFIEMMAGRLRDRLGTYYQELDSEGALIAGKALGGPYAKTFRFELRFKMVTHTIFVKICPVYEKVNPARMEYDTLRVLYEKMPEFNRNCGVSRPLDFFPDLNAYVMESVGTGDFKSYLLKTNSLLAGNDSRANLMKALRGCAEWLRAFHDVTLSGKSVKFDNETFLDTIRREFDYKRLRGFWFNATTLDKLDKVLGRLSSMEGTIHLPCAKWHWDYTPGHVYILEGKTRVIDILGYDDVPIYEDIGHFLVAMTIVNNLPFYPLFHRKRAGRELCDIFLDSYMSGRGELEKREFLLLSNIYKLKYFIFYFGGQYQRVCERIHPTVGKIFANLRSARLISVPLGDTIDKINEMLDERAAVYA